MNTRSPFESGDESATRQIGLFDESHGINVVNAKFISASHFNWDLFDGFDTLRVLTYSVSVDAVIRILEQFEFERFECIFGSEAILNEFKTIIAFQKYVTEQTRTAILKLKDDRHRRILKQVHSGKASFRLLNKYVSHAKLYLLENQDGSKRVITGSANLSERAFSESQPESLVVFDNDQSAWVHYEAMYTSIRDTSTDEIDIPEEQIEKAEIEVSDTPVLADEDRQLLVVQPPLPQESFSVPAQAERIESLRRATIDRQSFTLPSIRNGIQRITPAVKREFRRIKFVKQHDTEADSHRNFTIDRINRKAVLNDEDFPLEFDDHCVENDVQSLVRYWNNYEGAFSGDVPRLQRDYWILMSWLYFSPFMCNMRAAALFKDDDVIRFPQFAVVFGKSNCGKTSLIDTLMTSMLGMAHTIEKRAFTATGLRALQYAYGRHPVVFDDVSRRAFRQHGIEVVKDEVLPVTNESPCFLLSLNADPHSFPDEVVKRSLMVYTTTALPTHKEHVRQSLQITVQDIRRTLTGHLYRKYLSKLMNVLDVDPFISDWLSSSSGIIREIFSEALHTELPDWCKQVTYLDYADHRYDRIKDRLNNLLRESTYSDREHTSNAGWTTDSGKLIYWEQRDAFGRSGFDWTEIPSTLLDTDASGGNRTVLHLDEVEEFLGRNLVHHPTVPSWISRMFRQKSTRTKIQDSS